MRALRVRLLAGASMPKHEAWLPVLTTAYINGRERIGINNTYTLNF